MSTRKQNKKRLIEYDIQYEEALGIHTYHRCRCGRGHTRKGKCVECLREELEALSAKSN